ncbi:MAG TPA: response regulator transcription factor [Mobilitalea sp.]|nr:response regulator transcription factor [Mobilitalea sp.]
MIKVLIVDDQMLMVQGLSMILSQEEALDIVGTASNGSEAVEFCRLHPVDVVLLDIRMPVMDGVEATLKIKEISSQIKILVLTTFNDDAYIFGSLKNGASGYLLKDALPDEILQGILTVYSGGTLINPDVATKVVERLTHTAPEEPLDVRLSNLTGREMDICHLLSTGKNNKEIGEVLFISEGTVKNNITRILDKLDIRDRTQLALFAVKNRI